MNAKQKKFILNKLIPFILREEGRGFAMSAWCHRNLPVGEEMFYDDTAREVPVCGTVACIGGSAQLLSSINGRPVANWERTIMGLTDEQADGLFYRREQGNQKRWGVGWPDKFAIRYKKAATPLGKAKVAVALLKEVVKTNGKCLEAKS